MKIVLKGNPPTTNQIYRSVCRGKFPTTYLSHEGRAIKDTYAWEAKAQIIGQDPFKGDVFLTVDFYFGDKRRRDIDNFNKLLYDSLTGILWEDDSQIMKVTTTKKYDKNDPRVELEVVELI